MLPPENAAFGVNVTSFPLGSSFAIRSAMAFFCNGVSLFMMFWHPESGSSSPVFPSERSILPPIRSHGRHVFTDDGAHGNGQYLGDLAVSKRTARAAERAEW